MTSEDKTQVSKVARWAGYIMSALPTLMFLMGAFMVLSKNPQALEGLPQMGYPVWLATPLGTVELLCTVLYIIPQTSVLGAILLTGYLGGAVATHVRIEDPKFVVAIIVGIFVWGGLYLRDPRIRALIPLRARPAGTTISDSQ